MGIPTVSWGCLEEKLRSLCSSDRSSAGLEPCHLDLKSLKSIPPPFSSPSLRGVDSQVHLACFNCAFLRKTGYG